MNLMNFYPKSITILESAPRILELRPPQDYAPNAPDPRPFDWAELRGSRTPFSLDLDAVSDDASPSAPPVIRAQAGLPPASADQGPFPPGAEAVESLLHAGIPEKTLLPLSGTSPASEKQAFAPLSVHARKRAPRPIPTDL